VRLCGYRSPAGWRVGLLPDDVDVVLDVVDVLDAAGVERTALGDDPSMREVIETWNAIADPLRSVCEGPLPSTLPALPLSEVELGPPVATCSTIYAVGLNYADHTVEFQSSGTPLPSYPVIFVKSTGASAAGSPIHLHQSMTQEVDYEGELGVVIGRAGRDIPASDAYSYVFGYTIVNDVTARDLQRRHQQWSIGKSLDTFCPVGPVVVPRDRFAWPPDVRITTTVNGEQRQHASTRSMIFDIGELIACISAGRLIQAGDIIATGTPSGVGMAMDPPEFLRVGDSVTVTIEGIGSLTSVCTAGDPVEQH
jgi:2-keto-4-pentenoate hydratase/2-oxohepta-3-ene-1,7-dioic acid hydratase in catechol pathway